MEAVPSPQCVGREFVRQYYTLLNKAPLHLHRFYSHDSSFVHGGLEGGMAEEVHGQQQIHEKIMELDFHDCKAKILLVDSHRTLENGVVVQVSGELSNNGQPMRRFVQTFVLAPQSAKKFYVRNDIFRYQDDIVFDDEDAADERASLETEEALQSRNVTDDILAEDQNATDERMLPQCVRETHSEHTIPVSTSAGAGIPQNFSAEVNPGTCYKPHDWFNLLKSTISRLKPVLPSTSCAARSTPRSSVQPGYGQPLESAAVNASDGFAASWMGRTHPTAFHYQLSYPAHQPNTSAYGVDNKKMDSGAQEPNSSHTARKLYPIDDSLEVFVGNIPHSVTEDTLKEFFQQFGHVVSVKIQGHGPRLQSDSSIPNYGFVRFDTPKAAEDALNKKPLLLNGQHRLNVEQKRRSTLKNSSPREQVGRGRGTRMSGRGWSSRRLRGRV